MNNTYTCSTKNSKAIENLTAKSTSEQNRIEEALTKDKQQIRSQTTRSISNIIQSSSSGLNRTSNSSINQSKVKQKQNSILSPRSGARVLRISTHQKEKDKNKNLSIKRGENLDGKKGNDSESSDSYGEEDNDGDIQIL